MKTKIFFTLFTICLSYTWLPSFGQTPAWQWARNAGMHGDDKGNSITIDAAGNLYATGWYTSPTITFGSYTLVNQGASDFFIVKYDAAGNVRWVKNQGGASGDVGYAIAADNKGNVYLTGWFSSPKIGFGTDTLINAGVGNTDIFVAKYDTAGNILWAKRAGGNAGDVAYGITTDAAGNVYVTGSYTSATGSFGGFTLNNAGTPLNEIFVMQYDAAGNVQWAKSAGGAKTDEGYGICADNNGNLYVTGYLASASSNFGSIPLTGAGGNDIFIAKYDATSGNALLAKSIGGTNDEEGDALVSVNGNLYVTGKFNSAGINFGPSSNLNNALTGTADVFIAKFDASLNALWARRAGGADDDAGSGITADANENIYATGMFVSASILFGTNSLNNTGSGYSNIWVAAYDASGNASWAVTATGDYEDMGKSLVLDALKNVYVTGKFNSSSLSFNTNTVYKGCGEDFFIAKLSTPVGLKEYFSGKEAALIYPNPNEGKFNVLLKKEERAKAIEIYNVMGEQLYAKKFSFHSSPETESIDLSQYPKGIYFYKVILENEPSTPLGKFIIR